MKTSLKITLIAALVIGAVGVTAIGIAYAGEAGPREGLAELLGLDREELRALLSSGSTIQELADEAGVDLEAYQEEMAANRQEEMKARIEEALAEGEISQDQADWLLEGLEKGYLNGPFFGPGGRRGMQPGFDGEGFPGLRGENFPCYQQ